MPLCMPLGVVVAPIGADTGFNSSAQPFLNVWKTGSVWQTDGNLGTTNLDADGYPLAMPPSGTYYGSIFQSTAYYTPGRWVFLYDGYDSGTRISYLDDATFVRDNSGGSTPGNTGRDILNVGNVNGLMHIRVTTTPASGHLTNFRLIYSPGSDSSNVYGAREALFNSGTRINPDYSAKIAPFKRYRFIEWMNGNNNANNGASLQTVWTGRPTPTTVWFGSDESYVYGSGQVIPNGVPVEYMCELCNTNNADAWFSMPAKADLVNYWPQFAASVFANLNSPLKCYFEYS